MRESEPGGPAFGREVFRGTECGHCVDVRLHAELLVLCYLRLGLETFQRSTEESQNGNTRLGLEHLNGGWGKYGVAGSGKGLLPLLNVRTFRLPRQVGNITQGHFQVRTHETDGCNMGFPNFPGEQGCWGKSSRTYSQFLFQIAQAAVDCTCAQGGGYQARG